MYASRKLKIHEKNYTTHGLGLGAVVFTLKIWKHLLVTRSWGKIYFAVLVDIAEGIGTRISMPFTTYHPQMERQSERTIQTLKDMLRASHVFWAEVGENQLIGPEMVKKLLID
ncbi:putative reverse transcriptase domain-containing protein [Tanacetum coccineum]